MLLFQAWAEIEPWRNYSQDEHKSWCSTFKTSAPAPFHIIKIHPTTIMKSKYFGNPESWLYFYNCCNVARIHPWSNVATKPTPLLYLLTGLSYSEGYWGSVSRCFESIHKIYIDKPTFLRWHGPSWLPSFKALLFAAFVSVLRMAPHCGVARPAGTYRVSTCWSRWSPTWAARQGSFCTVSTVIQVELNWKTEEWIADSVQLRWRVKLWIRKDETTSFHDAWYDDVH